MQLCTLVNESSWCWMLTTTPLPEQLSLDAGWLVVCDHLVA